MDGDAGSGSQAQAETAAGEAQPSNGAVSETDVAAQLEALASGGVSPTEQPAEEGTPSTDAAESEAEDAAEAKAEESDEDKADDADADKKDAPHGEVKRINKLTARAKAAEEKAASLEKELAELKAKPAISPEVLAKLDIPPEYVTADEAKVLSQHSDLQQRFSWLKANRSGFSGQVNGQAVEFSAEQIAEAREEVLLRMVAVAPRAEAIRERAQAELAKDLAAIRQNRSKPASTTPAAVKQKLKPTVHVPSGSGISPQNVMGAPKQGVNLIFQNNRGKGDVEAAAAALEAFAPRT